MARAKRDPRSSGKVDKDMGVLVRERRQELAISQSDLAKHLGISFQQIQKYEKGTNRISAGRLVQIAEALKTPITDFYANETKGKDHKVDTMLNGSLDAGSMKLLRAFSRIQNVTLRRHFVTLIEGIAKVK
jgi:transcriptional regulator with XRE-family HTH domain